MNKKMLMAGLIAAIMVACAIPALASDDSDAWSSSNLSLNTTAATLYLNEADGCSLDLTVSDVPDGMTDKLVWEVIDIDDGGQLVSFDAAHTQFTATGVTSVTAYAVASGSIEVKVYINGQEEEYYAAAIIAVYEEKGDAATMFTFTFKISADALAAAGVTDKVIIPAGYDLQNDFTYANSDTRSTTGVTVTVTLKETGMSQDQFNAYTALAWFAEKNNWDFAGYADSGWIDHLLGLYTYTDADYNYIYWMQYHMEGGKEVLNDVCLAYITTADQSNIILDFATYVM